MKKFMLLALGAGALALVSQPPAAEAQVAEALSLTTQAVKELTDYPGLGKRTTVDLNARSGADVGQMDKAAALLGDALGKAKSGGADKMAILQLDLAHRYAKSREHKEARLSAQGAQFYLCKQNNNQPEDVCNTVPKYGSYVAP